MARLMPIVTQCTAPGCETLTMGPLCVEHDAPVTRVFVRGRPWKPPVAVQTEPTLTIADLEAALAVKPARRAWAPRKAVRVLR
jgi:hypothetical protein